MLLRKKVTNSKHRCHLCRICFGFKYAKLWMHGWCPCDETGSIFSFAIQIKESIMYVVHQAIEQLYIYFFLYHYSLIFRAPYWEVISNPVSLLLWHLENLAPQNRVGSEDFSLKLGFKVFSLKLDHAILVSPTHLHLSLFSSLASSFLDMKIVLSSFTSIGVRKVSLLGHMSMCS